MDEQPTAPMAPFRIAFGNEKFLDLSEQEGYEFPHPVQRWVMPVMILRSRNGQLAEARVVGTCFTIAPGLAVTAKHVLTDDFVFAETGAAPAEIGVAIVYVTDESMPGHRGAWGGMLDVDKIVANDDHDLALLRFKAPYVDGRFPSFPVARSRLTRRPWGHPSWFLATQTHPRHSGRPTQWNSRKRSEPRVARSRSYTYRAGTPWS